MTKKCIKGRIKGSLRRVKAPQGSIRHKFVQSQQVKIEMTLMVLSTPCR